ncbi:rRNA pseudouridine synthase [Candidatus Berkelbacteria bacterium]|nr:rRNA pseudouridine synthase [Candidatus Berkelbacteria bacterium]
MRLNKFLSSSGIAARRKADELIQAGRVAVNGKIVTQLGTLIHAEREIIAVDGETVMPDQKRVVYALYKPRGLIITDVNSLVPGEPRVFSVGRLDQESEGLVLVTNDGELAFRLTHPRFEHKKIYQAWVPVPNRYDLSELESKLKRPHRLANRASQFDRVKYLGRDEIGLIFELEVHEGRKHLVRRLLDCAGLATLRLKRIQHGPISLGQLKPGEFRVLKPEEFVK